MGVNHTRFLSHLDQSEDAKWIIARWLYRHGFDVKVNASGRARNAGEWRDFIDRGDLELCLRCEAKQRRNLEFTPNKKYRYPDFLLCAQHSFDDAVPKPFMYFVLDMTGKTVAIVKASSHKTWQARPHGDMRYGEGYDQKGYFVPLDQVHMMAFSELLEDPLEEFVLEFPHEKRKIHYPD